MSTQLKSDEEAKTLILLNSTSYRWGASYDPSPVSYADTASTSPSSQSTSTMTSVLPLTSNELSIITNPGITTPPADTSKSDSPPTVQPVPKTAAGLAPTAVASPAMPGRSNASVSSAIPTEQPNEAAIPSSIMSILPSTATSIEDFYVSNGRVIGPNGQNFIARGINLYASQIGSANEILAMFPGINMVRLAVQSLAMTSPASLQTFISQMTAHGVVVEIEDHSAPTANNNIPTGAALTSELAWYSSMAAAYASNPYVWFGTMNEPDDVSNLQAIAVQESDIYKAIRAAGDNNPIMLETRGGYTADFAQQNPSYYQSMTNVIWDVHYYGWIPGYSTNPTIVTNDLTAEIANAQTVKSATGTIPVIVGEYGTSTTGSGAADADGTQVVSAVGESGYGSLAWAFSAGTDQLVSGNSLTAYGQQVAAFIAASSGQSSRPTGVSILGVTEVPAAARTSNVLAANSSLAIVAQVGGASRESYTYTLGGSGAAAFKLSTANNIATLSTGASTVAGAVNGRLYGLTLTATDLTGGIASPVTPLDVVIGSGGSDTVQISKLVGASETATPTLIYDFGGNDTIHGAGMTSGLWFFSGTGADVMTGGSGANDYLYDDTSDSTSTAMDVITNFHTGMDMIDLTGLGTSLTCAGQLSSQELGGHLVGWQVSGSNTFIYVNTGSTIESLKATDMKIELQGIIALDSGNILHS